MSSLIPIFYTSQTNTYMSFAVNKITFFTTNMLCLQPPRWFAVSISYSSSNFASIRVTYPNIKRKSKTMLNREKVRKTKCFDNIGRIKPSRKYWNINQIQVEEYCFSRLKYNCFWSLSSVIKLEIFKAQIFI